MNSLSHSDDEHRRKTGRGGLTRVGDWSNHHFVRGVHLAMSDWLHRCPLVIAAAMACVGVGADTFLRSGLVVWLTIFVGLIFWLFLGPQRGRVLIAMTLVIPLFAIRHHVDETHYRSAGILEWIDEQSQPAILNVIVDRSPVLRRHPIAVQRRMRGQSELQTQFEARVISFRHDDAFVETTGRLLITVDEEVADIRVGNTVRVYGEVHRIRPPSNPGQSDLREVYRRRALHGLIHLENGSSIEHKPAMPVEPANAANSIHRIVDRVSSRARRSLLQHTDPATGPLAMALVLGQRDLVDNQTRDRLLVTGTAHLLSVSGLHLAIVAAMVQLVTLVLGIPPTPRVIILLIVCVAYTAITGGRPPVVRAAILIAALSLSWMTHRTMIPMNSLGLAALVLLLWNPPLLFGVGVHLSFLAVATLLLCGDRPPRKSAVVEEELRREDELEKLVDKSKPFWSFHLRRLWRGFGQALIYSAAVTVVSAPLVWHQFHVVSPISVLANVALGPLMFVALGSGLATVLVDAVVPPLAIFPGWVCDQSLSFMQSLIDFAAAIPFGHVWLPRPPALWVTTFYVMLIGGFLVWLVYVRYINREGRPGWYPAKTVATLLAMWFVSAWWLCTRPSDLPNQTIEVTFVDVGHGTAAIVRCDETTWLYDCGHLGNDLGDSRGIEDVLWSLGTTILDCVVISHADADHFNALPGILNRFGVDKIITPPGMLAEDEEALIPIREAIQEFGVPVIEHSRNTGVLDFQALRAEIVHPPHLRVSGSDNANSLVLILNHSSTPNAPPIVLPGDLEPPGTQTLINQPRPIPGGVIMAPHHGSLRADAEAVLRWARPSAVAVSGGRRTDSDAVRQTLASTGAAVHLTHDVGAVRVRVDGKKDANTEIEIRGWKNQPW